MAVKFDIHLASNISVWNGILTFVPPYMGVAADFMPIGPFTDFIGDKRQDSQGWSFFRFKDAPAAAVAILPTEPSTLAFCFGFLTPVGMMAME